MSSKLYKMKTKFLLPYVFKRWGAFMAPLGLTGWAIAQLHGLDSLIRFVIPPKGTIDTPWNLAANQFWFIVGFMIVMFCSFLAGMLFLVFSQEKVEDEYTRKVRLESYQFAALSQFAIYFLLIILAIVDAFIHKFYPKSFCQLIKMW